MKKLLSIIAFVAISGFVLGQQLNLTMSSTNVTCYGSCNGTATATVSGGTPPYTYMWSDSLMNSTSTASTASNLCAGIYEVTVTDVQSNSAVGTVTILQPDAISATFVTHNPTSPNSSDGYIETTVTGGTAPYSYTWSNNQNTANIYNLSSGTYNLTVMDSNGCIATASASLNNGQNSCQAYYSYSYLDSMNVSQYSFVGLATYDSTSYITSWNWSFGDGTSSTAQNPIHSFGSGLHTVCLTIATSSGCTSTYCDSIYVNGNNTSACQAYFYSYPDSMNVPPMQQYNFVDQSIPDSTNTIVGWSWTFPGGTPATSTVQNPYGVVFQAGTYTICLTIATSSGCSSNYCETITVGNGCQLYANITTQNPTTIGGNDGYIESSVSGGTPPYSYTWSNGANTQSIYHLTSGMYTLNVVDANGCQNTFYASLYEPYDTTGGQIVDTLYTNPFDSCLNFIPDSFYISTYTIDSNTVSVVWVFTGSGQTVTLTMVYTFSQYGNTLVVLTLNCGSKKTLTTYQSYINIRHNLSVPVYGNDMGVFAYPVPFSAQLNIAFTTSCSENVNLSLIDASGRVLISKKINAWSGINNTEINTSQLPAGMYILNLVSSNGIVRKQVVK